MNLAGVRAVTHVECAKLASQIKTRIALAACAAGPLVFAVVMQLQSSLPEDTLFGRSVKDSGFALSLVVLGFAGFWALPVLTSLAGGDMFSAEDRYLTWKTVLTRSRTRSEVFAGKVVASVLFSLLAVTVLAASSIAAGVLVLGRTPLVGLSGDLLEPSHALRQVALAWLSIVPPICALTGVAVLLSVATRSSAVGIGLPVVITFVLQLCSLIDGPEIVRRMLITSAFGAWHGLFTDPPYHGPILYGAGVSLVYGAVSLAIAYRILLRRDFAS